MITFRSIASPSQDAPRSVGSPPGAPGKIQSRALHQDDGGPLDGELLDLYVAILIVVPAACLLRYLWS